MEFICFIIDIPGGEFNWDDMNKIKNNTIIGDGGYTEQDEEILRSVLQKNLINLPGATPMNTQMDEDRD